MSIKHLYKYIGALIYFILEVPFVKVKRMSISLGDQSIPFAGGHNGVRMK